MLHLEKIKISITIIVHILFSFSCNKNNNIKQFDIKVEKFIKDTVINNIDFVYVPSGPYKSGFACSQDSINYDYFIGKYEITNLQYYNFIICSMKDSTIILKNNILYYSYQGDELVPKDIYRIKMFDGRIFLKDGTIILNEEFSQHPVISVTWYGAKAFCEYYGFDLPTEAEWEKAARGNQCLWFPWGNNIDSSYANYFKSGDFFEPNTTPVGYFNGDLHQYFQTSDASSVYGCYDMSGNAWEWIGDAISKDIPFHKGKGGGFNYHTPAFLQVYYVSYFGPEKRPPLDMCDLPDGFRVLKKSL